MTLIQTLLIGFVEGVTEFLPISSTAHMTLSASLLHITQTDFVKSFEIIVQLGAIAAVVVLYGKHLLTTRALWLKLFIGFLPTGIIGFLLYKVVKEFLIGNVFISVIALLIGGILFIILELICGKKDQPTKSLESITLFQALWIGLTQSISIIPGVSRAAATMFGGMIMGLTRETAVEFSFLLAIPTMLAASGYDLLKTNASYSHENVLTLGIGFVVSFLTALGTVKVFTGFMKHATFIPFGIYRIILSIGFLLIFWR